VISQHESYEETKGERETLFPMNYAECRAYFISMYFLEILTFRMLHSLRVEFGIKDSSFFLFCTVYIRPKQYCSRQYISICLTDSCKQLGKLVHQKKVCLSLRRNVVFLLGVLMFCFSFSFIDRGNRKTYEESFYHSPSVNPNRTLYFSFRLLRILSVLTSNNFITMFVH
jgi:hypothetical protein